MNEIKIFEKISELDDIRRDDIKDNSFDDIKRYQNLKRYFLMNKMKIFIMVMHGTACE